MTDDKLKEPVLKKIEDMLPTDSFAAIIENATPIPGIQPAGNIKTYCKAFVSHHLVEIHMGDHCIGSFKVHADRVDFSFIEPLWNKFEVDKATLLFMLKPDFEKK
jgi:hypothetical protein